MSIQDAIAKASAKPAGKRPYSFTPEVERVLAITLAVSAELAVTRQRLDTVERLLAAKGVVAQDEIDNFVPSETDHAERGLWNQEYVARIFRIIQQEAEAVEAAVANERSSEELHEELETEKA
ncbi:hypothetical protein P1X14_09845 [Sphingomonas sp. AOB5]|uniref:hypothetical protein n=1 Tax=Sphingomonas sp. AOB5 TaxID=3034017 RepID=UPI0023F737C6|nr:hypothetical protein [Sphingomonas sp. AOB5]MDF7775547.1 hypothetical protein [Sphingomonas sp. AOB5]